MMKQTLIAVAALIAIPAIASAQDTTTYDVKINAIWTAQSHPLDYPSSAHLSGFVAATHNKSYALFTDGGTATKGLETLSETGNGGPLSEEAKAAMAKGKVGDIASTGPLFTFPGKLAFKIKADKAHSRLTFAAMVAPSPDWFTGASGVSLLKDGKWANELKVTLYAWDAGTDSGTSYGSADADTQPRQSVRMNTSKQFMRDSGLKPVGTATITRVIATN